MFPAYLSSDIFEAAMHIEDSLLSLRSMRRGDISIEMHRPWVQKKMENQPWGITLI